MTDWRTVALADVTTWLSGGTPRKSESRYWEEGTIPWISATSLKGERLADSDRRVTKAAVGNGTRLAPRDSTLILVRGMSLLEEIRVGRCTREMAFNQDVKALVPEPGVLDPRFLTYALLARRPEILGMVHQAGHGTGVLATERLKSLRLTLPDLPTQAAAVGALEALDDLVEIDRQEARRARALASAIGARFLTEVAAIAPRTTVPEIAEIAKGYSYSSAELAPGGDSWLVGLKNVGRDGSFQRRGFKPLTPLAVKEHQVIDNGDVVVAQTDLTQQREVVGRPVRVRRGLLAGRFVASLDLVIVRPRSGFTREYLFAALSSAEFRSHALAYCNGTTVVHMGARALPEFEVPVPRMDSMQRFSEGVRPMWELADQADAEADRLERIRDELLPLLMSGRIRHGEGAS